VGGAHAGKGFVVSLPAPARQLALPQQARQLAEQRLPQRQLPLPPAASGSVRQRRPGSTAILSWSGMALATALLYKVHIGAQRHSTSQAFGRLTAL